MAYMAVGSRQILFSDAAAPAVARDDGREVANLSDNTQVEASRPAASPAPPPPRTEAVAPDSGSSIDYRA